MNDQCRLKHVIYFSLSNNITGPRRVNAFLLGSRPSKAKPGLLAIIMKSCIKNKNLSNSR